MKRMEDFFSQWHEKVNVQMHEVLMERQNFRSMMDNNANLQIEEKKKMRRVEIE